MMIVSDNLIRFNELIDKHLYFVPQGFGDGYDDKFTRFSQIYLILNMFLLHYFEKKESKEIYLKLENYGHHFFEEKFLEINYDDELEIIEFLLSLEKLPDLRR